LERQLAKGDKALVGNAGFRRYLKAIGGERFAIDPSAHQHRSQPTRGHAFVQAIMDGGADLPDR
jgi:hypothetical protein